MKPASPDRANMVIILRNHAPGTPLPHHDTDQSSAQETARYSHSRKTPTILRRIRPCLRKRSGPHITPTIIFGWNMGSNRSDRTFGIPYPRFHPRTKVLTACKHSSGP